MFDHCGFSRVKHRFPLNIIRTKKYLTVISNPYGNPGLFSDCTILFTIQGNLNAVNG